MSALGWKQTFQAFDGLVQPSLDIGNDGFAQIAPFPKSRDLATSLWLHAASALESADLRCKRGQKKHDRMVEVRD